MSKPKEAPALLEVYGRRRFQRTTRRLTAWPGKQISRIRAWSSRRQTTAPARPGESWVRAAGERVRFSMSTLGLALALFAVITVCGAGYWLGGEMGYQRGLNDAVRRAELVSNDEFSQLREEAPTAGLLDDLDLVDDAVAAGQRREAMAQPRTRTQGFVDNLNYIWIESCKNYDDALDAQSYLLSERVQAVVVEGDKEYVLISAQGFDYSNPADKQACLGLQQRITRLGESYLNAGGRYRFQSFVKKKRPGETW